MEIVSTDTILPGADIGLLNNILGTAADIILIVDQVGTIKEARFQGESRSVFEGLEWEGKNIQDVVSVGCTKKVKRLLQLPTLEQPPRTLQISHPSANDTDVPVTYRATQLNAQGDLVLFGQSEAKLTEIQNRLFKSQITLDREISDIRRRDDIYRNIFKKSRTPQLIAEVETLQVVDLNREAKNLFGPKSSEDKRPVIFELFSDDDKSILHKILLSSADNSLGAVPIKLGDGSTAELRTSYHLMDGKNHVLLEIFHGADTAAPVELPQTSGDVSDLIEVMPDAYVVLDEDRKITAANLLFYKLFNIPDNHDLKFLNLETLFSESEADAGDLFSDLHRSGVAKREAAAVTTLGGAQIMVEITGHKFINDQTACLGLSFRKIVDFDHAGEASATDSDLPDQWVESLVQTMSLKEIVRQTTDSMERLCIDQALKLTGNRRASAAKLLGISRQNLYLKMKSYSKT